jgi:adenylosuccinate synthase
MLTLSNYPYELIYPDDKVKEVKDTLEYIKNFYNDIDLSEQVEEFLVLCNEMTMIENFKLTYGIPEGFYDHINGISDDIIFEGSQGLLLDQHYGFFPHVTRGNVGTTNILEINGGNDVDLYLVTRAYQTRHGNGPMTNDSIDFDVDNPNETNVDNEYQGEFRKSILDVSLLEYGINKDKYIRNNNKNLVITCLDQVDEYVFTYNGLMELCKDEDEFVTRISDILNVEHVFISKSNISENIEKFK